MLLKIRQAGGAGRGRTAAAPTLDINARGARHHGPQRIALCYVLVIYVVLRLNISFNFLVQLSFQNVQYKYSHTYNVCVEALGFGLCATVQILINECLLFIRERS